MRAEFASHRDALEQQLRDAETAIERAERLHANAMRDVEAARAQSKRRRLPRCARRRSGYDEHVQQAEALRRETDAARIEAASRQQALEAQLDEAHGAIERRRARPRGREEQSGRATHRPPTRGRRAAGGRARRARSDGPPARRDDGRPPARRGPGRPRATGGRGTRRAAAGRGRWRARGGDRSASEFAGRVAPVRGRHTIRPNGSTPWR